MRPSCLERSAEGRCTIASVGKSVTLSSIQRDGLVPKASFEAAFTSIIFTAQARKVLWSATFMVAEQNRSPKQSTPGTAGAMELGSGASQVVIGMQTPIPQSDTNAIGLTPATSSGSGLEAGAGATPGAGSNSLGQGSVPVSRRDHKRVKERLVNVNEVMRQKLKYLHESVHNEET